MTTIQTCFGKIPIHGDFVRHNQAQSAEIAAFERWLADGVERLYGVHGRGVEAALRAIEPLAFVLQPPRSPRMMIGLLTASADRVGRVWPLVLGRSLPAPAAGPAFDRLPVQMLEFVAAAVALVASHQAGTTLPGFLAALPALPELLADGIAEQRLRGYLLGTALDELLAEVAPLAGAERRRRLVHELHSLLQPPFPPRFVATLPARDGALTAAFWLTWLRQWQTAVFNPVLVAWPVSGRGALRLLFDELQPRYLSAVLWPDREHEFRFDLARVEGRPLPAESGPAAPAGTTLLQDVVLAAARG
ncbi:MAG: type VI secretion system-associated protein TagF [Planctomycetes bacterium]|nr:type VI secretion system-associated protein TagF [Planctomycetota bacterium]